jgi:membrane associated rhomboid family serine protease
MLIPLRTCSLYNQSPLPNWGIIGTCVAIYLAMISPGPKDWVEALVLVDATPSGLFGHMFVHAGILHLVGNMLFLWVFGNTVCAKVGPILYVPVYLLCGLGAAFCHLLMTTNAPAVGASGAINGVIAFYLVLQPVNDVDMLFLFLWRGIRFTIAGFWVILFWFAWDIFGLMHGSHSRVAFTAHVGGFVTGFVLGNLFIVLKLVKMDEYDNPTLPEYLGFLPKGWSSPPPEEREPKPEPVTYEPPPEVSHRAPVEPRQPIAFRPASDEPLKPFADRVRPGALPPTVQTFDCPHCQEALELDTASPPTSASLLCPACRGTIKLVLE